MPEPWEMTVEKLRKEAEELADDFEAADQEAAGLFAQIFGQNTDDAAAEESEAEPTNET